MGKLSRFFPHIVICLLVAGLMAACGSKNDTTTITSTTDPSVLYSHVTALRNTDTLYVWGANNLGQLGTYDKSGLNSSTPILPLNLPKATGGAAGGSHTIALTTSGAVKAWGNNAYGQVGNGNQVVQLSPVQVMAQYSSLTSAKPPLALTGVTAVAAGGNHSLALYQSGEIFAWGNNGNGQLGDTTTTTRLIAYKVSNGVAGSPLLGATKVAAGGSHSLAVVGANATAYAWGYNGFGQLGQPKTFGTYSTSRDYHYPVPVVKSTDGTLLSNVVDIAAGGSHSLFIVNDGVNPARIWACGYNSQGQLGLGDIADRHVGAVQLTAFDAPAFPLQVAAGLDHSLALMSDGTVWAWGLNFSGQLGNGASLSSIGTQKLIPVQVQTAKGVYLKDIVKIIAIGNSSYAVDSSHQLWVWGDNTFGQLGLGTTASQNYATKIPNITDFDLYHP